VPGPLPSPVLLRVERAPDGYVLIGRGFGADAGALKILEGSRELPRSAIVSITPDRIVVRSRVVGSVQHRVILSGRASAVITLDHGGRVATPATTGNLAPAPGSGAATGPPVSARGGVTPPMPGTGPTARSGPGSTAIGSPSLRLRSAMVTTSKIHMRGTRPLAVGSLGLSTAAPAASPTLPAGGSGGPATRGPSGTGAMPGAAGGTAAAQTAHPALLPNVETTQTIHMRGSRPVAAGSLGSSTAAPVGSPGMPGGGTSQ
jgi:hypothetical protein